MRKVHARHHSKQAPGHHIQTDVRFLTFKGKQGQKIKRYQFPAMDEATRVRAMKICKRHNQTSAIDRFPFRIREIRTNNGHEVRARFHWHVEDKGIRHACIKPRSPQLDGKVERSHRTDEQEFCQRLSCKGDVDLEAKLDEREHLYNLARPHGTFHGKTP